MDHEVIGIYYLAACPQVYCVLNIYLTLFCEVTWNLSHQDLHAITTATVLKSLSDIGKRFFHLIEHNILADRNHDVIWKRLLILVYYVMLKCSWWLKLVFVLFIFFRTSFWNICSARPLSWNSRCSLKISQSF